MRCADQAVESGAPGENNAERKDDTVQRLEGNERREITRSRDAEVQDCLNSKHNA
ncbi:hypothetical protein RAZWK3B_18338 [Roseobacter sp. AzwK-3b]|nr:hypothetical protein RAZWK3B_18338 [Roseobacter sp. AzwK-3b]